MSSLTSSQHTFRRDLAASGQMLRRRALALTRSTQQVDDLVQDTMERALRFEGSYEPGSNFAAWLTRILHNAFMSQCRRRGIERRVLQRVALAERDDRQKPLQPWLSPKLERALDALPEKIGSVVRLVDLHDLTYGEAAGVLDVPVGTVMSRLHRGRKRLASSLAEAPQGRGEGAVACAA